MYKAPFILIHSIILHNYTIQPLPYKWKSIISTSTIKIYEVYIHTLIKNVKGIRFRVLVTGQHKLGHIAYTSLLVAIDRREKSSGNEWK
jgi:hypothetical protein